MKHIIPIKQILLENVLGKMAVGAAIGGVLGNNFIDDSTQNIHNGLGIYNQITPTNLEVQNSDPRLLSTGLGSLTGAALAAAIPNKVNRIKSFIRK